MEALATRLVQGLELYAVLGGLFALAFVLRGAGRIDPNARGATWGFRVLIFPGSAALWPWLLVRWIRASEAREEKSPHREHARGRGGAA